MDAPVDETPQEQVAPAAEEMEVVGERPAADTSSFAVTVVPVDGSLPPSADVAMAVQRAPGVHVQRLGGLGDYSSVSIRGGTARQVEVFVDGLPLNPEGGAAANLTELPLWAFERVEVYRGLAPLALDSSAMGGVVNLVSRPSGEGSTRGALSGGSWGTLRAQVVHEGPWVWDGARFFVAMDGLATEGDHRWFDDGGTRGDDSDDVVVERRNNDTEQVSTVLRLRVGDARAGVDVSDAWLLRDEGVPGTTYDPVDRVRYEVHRHLPSVTAHRVWGAARAEGRLFGVVRREVLDDPLGELGAPRREATATDALGGRAQLDAAFDRALAATAMASVRRDVLDGLGVRTVSRAGVEGSWSPSWGGASMTARLLGADGSWWGMPRAGVRWGSDRIGLRAGAGRAVRIPDLTERFGDRGVLVGNPDLRAERAWTMDASAVWSPGAGRVEVGGFVTDSRDRIVWARNAQGLARPDNVDQALLAGLEGAASATWGPVDVAASAAWTEARDRGSDPAYAGNQLPGVPVLEAWTRVGVTGTSRWLEVEAGLDTSFTAGTYDDPTNFYLQAPRRLHGATLQGGKNGWRLGADVRNLGNRLVQLVPRDPLVDDDVRVPQPLEDFSGMPLVGRTLLFTVSYDPGASSDAAP